MNIGTKLLVLVLASVLIGTVAAANLQQTYAPRGCSGCTEFKKLTSEYEKNVINAIGDPGLSPGPRELLQSYVNDVNRIFLGGPDTIPALLQSYERDVTTIFDSQPPDPDKQIKDFRGLTHDFEKAVIGLVQPPDLDTPA